MEFDITLYRMPAFDKRWINIFHLTQNGNADKENILKLSIFRNGGTGKFGFKYGRKTKYMHFVIGTTYHVSIDQYKSRRGKRYTFVITVDDDDIVNEVVKGIPKAHNKVKLFSSNPWEKTMEAKVGVVKNFVMTTEKSSQCCKNVIIKIDDAYLSSSHAELQKSLLGEYSYKGTKNGRGYWVKALTLKHI